MQAQLRLGAPEQVLSVPRQVDGRTLLVPLSQVASWQVTMSASDVRRYDWQKEIRLSANVDGTSMGEATEARAPMAHAILGGVITSMLLTLVVVPTIYALIHERRERAADGCGASLLR